MKTARVRDLQRSWCYYNHVPDKLVVCSLVELRHSGGGYVHWGEPQWVCKSCLANRCKGRFRYTLDRRSSENPRRGRTK